MALVGVFVIGPRIGKFGPDGKVNRIPPHNMTMAYLGTFILFFGWFGFNCGSTLEATPDIAAIALNTLLAACFGSISAAALSWYFCQMKRPEGEMIANGMLGGLVGITAGCYFVNTTGAALIGLSSGVVVYFGSLFIERVLKLDDVVGAISVHGFCGAWGTLCVGFFIRPELLGEMTRMQQIGIQALGVGAAFVWTVGVGFVLLKFIDFIFGGLRVSPEDEEMGLNVAEHGASSSLIDLANAMHRATTSGRFDESVKVEVEHGTEIGDLGRGFNQMVDAVSTALAETRRQVQAVSKARRDTEKARSVLEGNREAFQQRIDEIASNLGTMMHQTQEALRGISVSAGSVAESVNGLQGESDAITGMVDTIENIALTTKLLSLNALVEAAHAGEQGRTFAVVAESMTELSDRTNQATGSISQVVDNISTRLSQLLESAEKQMRTVESGIEQINQAAGLVRSLLDSDTEQAAQVHDLNVAPRAV